MPCTEQPYTVVDWIMLAAVAVFVIVQVIRIARPGGAVDRFMDRDLGPDLRRFWGWIRRRG